MLDPASNSCPSPHPRPPFAAGVVDVWRADVDLIGEATAELLSSAERLRAARILDARRRARWMRSRGLLRALLGAYLRVDPRTLRFAYGPRGKPLLVGGVGGSPSPAHPHERGLPLSFNLSHSGAVALYAVTAGAAVGIDLEVHRERRLDEPALALRALGAAAARRLLAIADPAARRREFLRLWVRHEAALKCRGGGLGSGEGAPVGLGAPVGRGGAPVGWGGAPVGWGGAPVGWEGAPVGRGGAPVGWEGAPVGSDAAAPAEGHGPELWISELSLGPGEAAAVAGEGGPRELRLLELPSCGPPRAPFTALRGHRGGPQAASSQPQPAV